jgi:phosphopantothenoylcysteine decarboxylase/phosphopantothenate--cysteine ligase
VKVLVTAGPTREPIDPVRFISNRSSGKMGYAIAAAALARGHRVRLVSGPVALAPPPGVRVVPVETADEMCAAVRRHLPWCDVLVMAAAVADWRPRHPAKRKLKKRAGPPRIAWEPAPDILQTIAPLKQPAQVFCGFAAETHALAREARHKLRAKNLDAIAANDVSRRDRGFASDRNALTIYGADGRVQVCPLAPKTKCAERLLDVLEEICARKKM